MLTVNSLQPLTTAPEPMTSNRDKSFHAQRGHKSGHTLVGLLMPDEALREGSTQNALKAPKFLIRNEPFQKKNRRLKQKLSTPAKPLTLLI